MNIEKWVVVAFVLFAAFIATLVVICMRQNISLVSKNYYQEELAFENHIQRVKNASSLEHKPEIKLVDHELHVSFVDFRKIENGKLILFCPSNDKMDRQFAVEQLASTSQTFELNGAQPGMYKAKLYWTMNKKEFYVEEIVNLQ
jgi:hypothetical protein